MLDGSLTWRGKVLEVNPKSQDAVHELLLLTSSSYSLPPHLARLINTTHLRLSDPDTALSFYHRLLPELNVRFLSREIRDEDFTSRARAALKALQHASELCEKSCELLCLLAELHWYLEEEEEAEICFRKSLSVHDSYERALVEFPRFLLQVILELEDASGLSICTDSPSGCPEHRETLR